jgi:glyoxylase-like metal-dependent hydrolase (beta-lactamase superfamily II)
MKPARLRIGEVDVWAWSDGLLSLDGGAMFGVVPKTKWAKTFEPDSDNRIAISLNSFLIKTPGHLALVETGAGTTLEGDLGRSYEFRPGPGLLAGLRGLGFETGDVDFVINTHLHFDHCGGNTVRTPAGAWEPTFGRASYIIQKGEWETALDPPERERSSYVPETFLPLEAAGRLRLVEGDARVCPEIEVRLAPGHTRHHQCVKVESEAAVLLILGDLVPTSAHVRFAYVMSYDLFPLETMAHKKKLFEQGIGGSWTYGFVHDPVHAFGRVERPGRSYTFRPLPG